MLLSVIKSNPRTAPSKGPKLPKTEAFLVEKPYTVYLPTFENPKKVAKENFESLFFETYNNDDGQQAAPPYSLNPSAYVVNSPLANPSSITTGYYPPSLLI
jgi:hypothetical protein